MIMKIQVAGISIGNARHFGTCCTAYHWTWMVSGATNLTLIQCGHQHNDFVNFMSCYPSRSNLLARHVQCDCTFTKTIVSITMSGRNQVLVAATSISEYNTKLHLPPSQHTARIVNELTLSHCVLPGEPMTIEESLTFHRRSPSLMNVNDLYLYLN